MEEAKWFTVRNVTVTDQNDYIVRSNIDYVDIWTELQKKLIDLKRIRKGADIATALHGLTLQTTHGYQSTFHS